VRPAYLTSLWQAAPVVRQQAFPSAQATPGSMHGAEQDGAVPPRHRGWLLHPVADEWFQALVLGIDVLDAELAR
jgi:hypothetical protein